VCVGCPVDDLKSALNVPGVRHHIYADEQGRIECITWTTDEQLALLNRYPDLIMMDGTYKVIFMACYGYCKVYFPDYLYSIAWDLLVSGGTLTLLIHSRNLHSLHWKCFFPGVTIRVLF